jgi:hypothetical protein
MNSRQIDTNFNNIIDWHTTLESKIKNAYSDLIYNCDEFPIPNVLIRDNKLF